MLSLTILSASIYKNENTHFRFYIVDLSLRHRARGTEMGTNRGRIASDSRGQRGGRPFQISDHGQPTGAVYIRPHFLWLHGGAISKGGSAARRKRRDYRNLQNRRSYRHSGQKRHSR